MATGLLFATTWLCATFWWLFISMHTYGDLAWPLAALAVGALAAALAGLYYALAAGVYWHFARRSAWARLNRLSALWTAAEMARGTWLTGFGWGAIGYAHGWPVGGAIPWSASMAWVRWRPGRCRAGASQWHQGYASGSCRCAGVRLGGHSLEHQSTEVGGHGQRHPAAGQHPQDEVSSPAVACRWPSPGTATCFCQRAPTSSSPRTAIPVLPQELPDGYWDTLRQRFSGRAGRGDRDAAGQLQPGLHQLGCGLGAGATEPQRYDKHHLVPFGEFIPPLFKWFTRMMNIPLGDFNRGAFWGSPRLRGTTNVWRPTSATKTCSERNWQPVSQPDMRPDDLRQCQQHRLVWRFDRHRPAPADQPHARWSLNAPMVRAANTGATAVIDHRGRVTHRLARATRRSGGYGGGAKV